MKRKLTPPTRRNVTVLLSPEDVRAARLQARAEGLTVSGLLRRRATEQALNLDPIRALCALLEYRASSGRLRLEEVRGLRDLAEVIGTTLSLLAEQEAAPPAKPPAKAGRSA